MKDFVGNTLRPIDTEMTTMNIRLRKQERDEFARKCEQKLQTRSAVLRRLMDMYVEDEVTVEIY
jgi:hypothetical protein